METFTKSAHKDHILPGFPHYVTQKMNYINTSEGDRIGSESQLSQASHDADNKQGADDEKVVPASHNKTDPLPAMFRPSPYSVVIGKGKESRHADGNQRLKVLAARFQAEYAIASKSAKSQIVSRVISIVEAACPPKAAFIRYSHDNGRWYEVEDEAAREKVGYTFRELLGYNYKSSSKSKVLARRSGHKKHQDVMGTYSRHLQEGEETSSMSAGDHSSCSSGDDSNQRDAQFDMENDDQRADAGADSGPGRRVSGQRHEEQTASNDVDAKKKGKVLSTPTHPDNPVTMGVRGDDAGTEDVDMVISAFTTTSDAHRQQKTQGRSDGGRKKSVKEMVRSRPSARLQHAMEEGGKDDHKPSFLNSSSPPPPTNASDPPEPLRNSRIVAKNRKRASSVGETTEDSHNNTAYKGENAETNISFAGGSRGRHGREDSHPDQEAR